MGSICFHPAVGAVAAELQMIGCDSAANLVFGCFHDGMGQIDAIQIQNRTAGCADEVGVRFGIVVIPFQTVDDTDGLDRTFFLEHSDVPVDGAQTEIRNFGLQLLVDPFGAGVTLGSTDTVENGISLSAVFSYSLHVALLFDINSYLRFDCNTSFSICKDKNKKNYRFNLSFLQRQKCAGGRKAGVGFEWIKKPKKIYAN